MRRTIYNTVRAFPSLNVAAVNANGTTNGAAVGADQSGMDYRVASVVAVSGAVTDGTYTFGVEESADGTTGWAAVPEHRIQGSAVVDAANEVAELGVVVDGAKPFLRATVTAASVTTGGTVGALILLGEGSGTPVARA